MTSSLGPAPPYPALRFTPQRRRRWRQRWRRMRTSRRRVLAAALIGLTLAVGAAVLGVRLAAGVPPAAPRAASETATKLKPMAHSGRTVGSRTGVLARNGPAQPLPFPPPRADRAARRGEVPSLYADGRWCSVGCRPKGAEVGWPLRPFHRQHPLRAGLNELRPGSLHVGLDIQARDRAAVYAVQPGTAEVLAASGPNARVQVGNYVYWHIDPDVRSGQVVRPFRTVLGRVMAGYGHIAFSEVNAAGDYVNPLRPRGTVLQPYVDRLAPVIGHPAVAAGGQVIVGAYDPQSFVRRTTYITPVLAPAALAYRLFDARGTAITPLLRAFGGTHLLPWVDRSLIYAPGAHAPGYTCFARRSTCVPHWVYRVAGGLTPPLPPAEAPGRYRLTIYAWDWADNVTALDTRLTLTRAGWQPVGHFPRILFRVPGYFTHWELSLGTNEHFGRRSTISPP